MGGIQLFKDKVNDEKLKLMSLINIIFTFSILFLLLINTSKQLFLVEAAGLTLDASKRDFCTLVTKQLIEKKLSKKIITESLYNLVTEDNYKSLYFEGEEQIAGLWTSDDTCKVLVKTKLGLRSFDYFFDQSKDFKYFYKIRKISENELYEKESS
jgi:hypothetical protein